MSSHHFNQLGNACDSKCQDRLIFSQKRQSKYIDKNSIFFKCLCFHLACGALYFLTILVIYYQSDHILEINSRRNVDYNTTNKYPSNIL